MSATRWMVFSCEREGIGTGPLEASVVHRPDFVRPPRIRPCRELGVCLTVDLQLEEWSWERCETASLGRDSRIAGV